MKIVFSSSSLSHRSGIERVACHLANLLVEKLDYQVSIITRDIENTEVAYPLNSTITIKNLIGNNFIFYKKIQYYIDEYNPNYIIVHNMGKLTLLCSFLKKRNSKIISLEHISFNSRSRWIRWISKLLYSKLDKVITLTQNDMLNYQSWVKECYTIYNISPFNPISTSININKLITNKKIIAIGRLTYQKNFEALLSAWKIIQDKIDDWSLEIYGVGEEYQFLRNIIDTNKLKNVKLMGLTNQIEKIYQQASIFVMSSRYEGLPMVLIEAQTFGLPIIAFDCPYGPSEIINHNKNGYLVTNQNIERLASYILNLAQQPNKIISFSKQALKDSERFQEKNILKLWQYEIFEDRENNHTIYY